MVSAKLEKLEDVLQANAKQIESLESEMRHSKQGTSFVSIFFKLSHFLFDIWMPRKDEIFLWLLMYS